MGKARIACLSPSLAFRRRSPISSDIRPTFKPEQIADTRIKIPADNITIATFIKTNIIIARR